MCPYLLQPNAGRGARLQPPTIGAEELTLPAKRSESVQTWHFGTSQNKKKPAASYTQGRERNVKKLLRKQLPAAIFAGTENPQKSRGKFGEDRGPARAY